MANGSKFPEASVSSITSQGGADQGADTPHYLKYKPLVRVFEPSPELTRNRLGQEEKFTPAFPRSYKTAVLPA